MTGLLEPFFDPAEYPVRDPDRIASPRLLVFRTHVEGNIARMRALLESAAPGSGFRHLRTHVKSCKSSWAVKRMLHAGITRFKATPNELSMLLDAGARDIFLAYPPLPPTADAIARAIAQALRFVPAAPSPFRLLAQISAPEHADALDRAARRHGVTVEFLIDLDVGMGRTGIAPDRAPDLLRSVLAGPAGERLRFAGLHAYEKHPAGASTADGGEIVETSMGRLAACARAIRALGRPVELIVAGGTPGFLPDLAWLLNDRTAEEIEVSPGTWVYWDSNYGLKMPGLFRPAALIFARVMDVTGTDRITLDLGHKRWAIDHGPIEVFSREGLEVVATSEEHTVIRHTGCDAGCAQPLGIGESVLLVPRHVCPTVNLWEDFTLIGPRGEVEIASCPVDGRNR